MHEREMLAAAFGIALGMKPLPKAGRFDLSVLDRAQSKTVENRHGKYIKIHFHFALPASRLWMADVLR